MTSMPVRKMRRLVCMFFFHAHSLRPQCCTRIFSPVHGLARLIVGRINRDFLPQPPCPPKWMAPAGAARKFRPGIRPFGGRQSAGDQDYRACECGDERAPASQSSIHRPSLIFVAHSNAFVMQAENADANILQETGAQHHVTTLTCHNSSSGCSRYIRDSARYHCGRRRS